MAGQIKIDTEQVVQIANSIESINQQLNEQLLESQNTIKNLSNTWEGQAATETISSFDEFSAKYFQNYYDIIDAYVKFLRVNVAAGYSETESANVTLADAFK